MLVTLATLVLVGWTGGARWRMPRLDALASAEPHVLRGAGRSPLLRDARVSTSSALHIRMRVSEDDAAGWEAVDQWLQSEDNKVNVATAKAPTTREVDEDLRPLTSTGGGLSQTSAGHVHDHFFSNSASDFAELGASEQLVTNLGMAGFHQPTCAQTDAFGAISRGDNVVLAQPPGTGKTLAYLVPLVDKLFKWDQTDGPASNGEVRCLVLVASSEMAQQVLSLVRRLARRKLKATIVTGEHNYSTQRDRIAGGLDVLIGTLGRVCAHIAPRGRRRSPFRGQVRALVVDDFDALYTMSGRARR